MIEAVTRAIVPKAGAADDEGIGAGQYSPCGPLLATSVATVQMRFKELARLSCSEGKVASAPDAL